MNTLKNSKDNPYPDFENLKYMILKITIQLLQLLQISRHVRFKFLEIESS